MKHTLLLITIISCFHINKSTAQVGMMNSSATSAPASNREFSGNNSSLSTNNASYNSRPEPASASRSQSTYQPATSYQPAPQGATYRNTAPMSTSYNAAAAGGLNPGYSNFSPYTGAPVAGNGGNMPSGSTAMSTVQATMRYNNAIKKNVPYFSSTSMKDKIEKRHHRDTKDLHPPHLGLRSSYVLYNCLDNPHEPIYDYASLYAGTLIYDNSALNASLDGYVVYNNDTLTGIVTITHEAILLEQPIDSARGYAYTFSYKDDALKTVVVFDGLKRLCLTRPQENGKELLRLLHTGKLNMYDDIYSFPTVENIDKTRIKIGYNGKLKSLGAAVKDGRSPLVKAVNKAYGLKLQTADMNWYNLLLYINKLN